MRHRRCSNAPSRGFALLHTLWLLGAATAALGVAVHAGLASSRLANAQFAQLRERAALESAMHAATFALLSSPPRQQVVEVTGTLGTPGYRVSVRHADGMVSMVGADAGGMERAWAAHMPAQRTSELIRGVQGEPGRVWADVMALPGMTDDLASCLAQWATLHSARAQPDAELAGQAEAMQGMAPPRPNLRQGFIVAEQVGLGRTWSLIADSRPGARYPRRLHAAVLLTGRIDRPFEVLDWQWLAAPGSGGTSACAGVAVR